MDLAGGFGSLGAVANCPGPGLFYIRCEERDKRQQVIRGSREPCQTQLTEAKLVQVGLAVLWFQSRELDLELAAQDDGPGSFLLCQLLDGVHMGILGDDPLGRVRHK